MWKTIKPFVVSIGIAFLVGALSQWASGGSDQSRIVYESLNLPALAVPGWVFGVVWPIWFALLGIAAALVYRSPASTEKSEGEYAKVVNSYSEKEQNINIAKSSQERE